MSPSLLAPTIIARNQEHLSMLIRQHQDKFTDACDLNHIDVSRVTSMKNLFAYSFFTGDISRWNVSNVRDTTGMFRGSLFNGSIADWDVSSALAMDEMFCASHFRGHLARWNTAMVQSMESMFQDSRFDGDLSNWNVGACTNFSAMFSGSRFNHDISMWDMHRAAQVNHMFFDSPFAHDVSTWQLPLACRMLSLFEACEKGMAAQRPADWHAKLHLDNWSRPPPGPLLDAFEELQSIHNALGSSNEERAGDLVRAVVAKMKGKGAVPSAEESWALPQDM